MYTICVGRYYIYKQRRLTQNFLTREQVRHYNYYTSTFLFAMNKLKFSWNLELVFGIPGGLHFPLLQKHNFQLSYLLLELIMKLCKNNGLLISKKILCYSKSLSFKLYYSFSDYLTDSTRCANSNYHSVTHKL